jgi:ABC-type transporter Mla maintaining outer membrane lipid asymmetry ATPase subunit MlaF
VAFLLPSAAWNYWYCLIPTWQWTALDIALFHGGLARDRHVHVCSQALFLQPMLLMLDEPTNHLDLDAVWVSEDLEMSDWKGLRQDTTSSLRSWQVDWIELNWIEVLWLDNYLSEQYPHAVVVVSHDADFLDSICALWGYGRQATVKCCMTLYDTLFIVDQVVCWFCHCRKI